MDLSPQQLRSTSFATSRKGYEPAEVDALIERVAEALESAQNHATAMEAKARAAVAKLQEVSAGSSGTPPAPSSHASVPADRADEISRTLLLAQRAADEALAEATAEADRLVEQARQEASTTIESTRSMAETMVEEARAEARAAGADERREVRSEVEALIARREFLTGDVDQLEQFLIEQRTRLREAAATIMDLTERVPGGLGPMRPPALSAAEATDGIADGDDETAVADADGASERGDGPAGPARSADPAASEHDSVPEDAGADTQALVITVDADGSGGPSETTSDPVLEPDDPTPSGDPSQLRFRPELLGRGDDASR